MKKMALLFLSLRPKHWVKNCFIFAGPFFALKLFSWHNLFILGLGFLVWCLITSAVYLFNDILDRKEDALHYSKRNRPIARGLLKVKMGYLLFFTLALLAILVALRLNLNFAISILLYFGINILYSLYLKHVFILDVICIAFGFLLRVASGAVLVGVGLSEWIIMCTFLLSLLLGFLKRQEEISSLQDNASHHRRVLKEYNRGFLEHIPYVLVAATILCYMLYTVSGEVVRKFGNKHLIYTAPFVIYGLFRYIYLAYAQKKGADPTQVLFQDLPTVINILLWIIAVGMIIYIK